MASCKKCNRPFKQGENQKNHVCDTVVVKDKSGKTRTVHADRVEKGGDLHDQIKNEDLKVVYRNKTRVEKLFEQEQERDRERKEQSV